MREQLPDKAYFVEMVFTHMRIIYKICNLYATQEDREDLKQEIIDKLIEINTYSDSLQYLIDRQLGFFKRPYEIWLFLASLSAIVLMTNVNLYVDNDNGTYVINNRVMFVVVTLVAFLIIYGAQKMAGNRSLRSLKAYLSDLQQGVLDQSDRIQHAKKRYIWIWLILFALLSASLIYGIIIAMGM